MTQKKLVSHCVDVTYSFDLYEWSELLTIDQLEETIVVIESYLRPDRITVFSPSDILIIEGWLSRNSLDKFKEQFEACLRAYENELMHIEKTKDIMRYGKKKQMSH